MLKRDGKKSVEVRQEKKKFRELVKELLNLEPTADIKKEFLSKYSEIEPGDITLKAVLIDRQIQKALKGDTRAFICIMETSGEVPNEPEPHEIKPPIINIEVKDNRHLQNLFDMYEEADRTGKPIEEVHDKWERWCELEKQHGNIIK